MRDRPEGTCFDGFPHRCGRCDRDIVEDSIEPRAALPAPPATTSNVSVGGGMMLCSMADHVRRCEVLLAEEQAKVLPNNALIACLCDSVRLTRECEALATGRRLATPAPKPDATKPATVDRRRCAECEAVVKFDEDGCCVTCGGDTRVVTIDAKDDPFKGAPKPSSGGTGVASVSPMTFKEVFEFAKSLPKEAWRKGYRVRAINVLARAVASKDVPEEFNDSWFMSIPNAGAGTIQEVRRLLVERSRIATKRSDSSSEVALEIETTCPKCHRPYAAHLGDETECVCPATKPSVDKKETDHAGDK